MAVGQPVRVGVVGCGFWSTYQIAGWREVPGVEVVAVHNRTRAKAAAVAARCGVPVVCDRLDDLLDQIRPTVVDIITAVESHAELVAQAAARGLPVICQKPLAPDLATARRMVETCATAGVPLWVHENWRWQTPLRAVATALASGAIGRVFRARVDFITGFPVFANQPFLAELEQFILTDMGSHLLDVARFLFGEMTRVYCQTHRVHPTIRGEDVATVVLRTAADATVTCNLAYAENHLEHDRFPETFVFVEGEAGSLELGPDYWLRVTTAEGTLARRCPPPRYAWADPAYDAVHASIPACCANLAAALRGETRGETTAADNLHSLQLVFAAYDSARTGQAVDPAAL